MCHTVFHTADLIGMYTRKVVEYMAFMYLRALSFEQIRAILGAWFEEDVIAKDKLIHHIEAVADTMPDQCALTKWLKPKRSGYYALDGTWIKYRGTDLVLLILFDVQTLDVVSYSVAQDEDEQAYRELVKPVMDELRDAKGFFCDGDTGLLAMLHALFFGVPVQLCVFHKYSRAGQIIPFVRVKNDVDRKTKHLTEKVLFAETKEATYAALAELRQHVEKNRTNAALRKLLQSIEHNFDLIVTHFDNPEMSPYNNVLEGFNHVLKRRIKLMKGFKKAENIDRWIKLLMLDWRFHELTSSSFNERNKRSPLHLADCNLPRKIHNWITWTREHYPKKKKMITQ